MADCDQYPHAHCQAGIHYPAPPCPVHGFVPAGCPQCPVRGSVAPVPPPAPATGVFPVTMIPPPVHNVNQTTHYQPVATTTTVTSTVTTPAPNTIAIPMPPSMPPACAAAQAQADLNYAAYVNAMHQARGPFNGRLESAAYTSVGGVPGAQGMSMSMSAAATAVPGVSGVGVSVPPPPMIAGPGVPAIAAAVPAVPVIAAAVPAAVPVVGACSHSGYATPPGGYWPGPVPPNRAPWDGGAVWSPSGPMPTERYYAQGGQTRPYC